MAAGNFFIRFPQSKTLAGDSRYRPHVGWFDVLSLANDAVVQGRRRLDTPGGSWSVTIGTDRGPEFINAVHQGSYGNTAEILAAGAADGKGVRSMTGMEGIGIYLGPVRGSDDNRYAVQIDFKLEFKKAYFIPGSYGTEAPDAKDDKTPPPPAAGKK